MERVSLGWKSCAACMSPVDPRPRGVSRKDVTGMQSSGKGGGKLGDISSEGKFVK